MISFSRPQKLRKSGRLSSIYYTRTYDNTTGSRSWLSTGCKSAKAAREWVRTREMDQALGRDRRELARRDKVTVSEAIKAWLEDKTGKVSEEYYKGLKFKAERYWLALVQPSFQAHLILADRRPILSLLADQLPQTIG